MLEWAAQSVRARPGVGLSAYGRTKTEASARASGAEQATVVSPMEPGAAAHSAGPQARNTGHGVRCAAESSQGRVPGYYSGNSINGVKGAPINGL